MARNWAITIGINEYPYLRSLQYATRDADAMRQLFLQELSFQKVYHFTDTSPPIPQDYGRDQNSRPTYTTLRRFLNKRFETPFLGDGDNLWFFFAGHGIRHEQTDYLMPADGDRTDLQNSAIPIHFIADRLRNSGADNVILLIDACRSYEGRRDGVGLGLEKQQGVITLFSCSPEESSYEIQELQQGAFTHVLLQSLQLQGEGNCATVERLYQRLRYYVPQLTRQYKCDAQTPYSVVEPTSKNHLILLPKQASPSDVVTLKNDAWRAEVQSRFKAAKQLWVRILDISGADPDAVEALERIARIGMILQPPPMSSLKQPEPTSPATAEPATPRTADIDTLPLPISEVTPSDLTEIASQDSSMFPETTVAGDVSDSTDNNPSQTPARTEEYAEGFTEIAEESETSDSSEKSSDETDDDLADGMCRRRAIQVIGAGLGGVGTILLGSNLLQSPSEPSLKDADRKTETPDQETSQSSMVFQESIDGVPLGLVLIPGGTFMMGSPNGQGSEHERPQHSVTTKPFLMSKYETTQAQWKAVSALPMVERDLEADPSIFKGAERPAENVSWHDAIEFCKRLSKYTGRDYRLPSEAEWEYACRAGTTTPFYFGETLISKLAQCKSNLGAAVLTMFSGHTASVGKFPANDFALYDMHGNVYEWCSDYWHKNYDGAPTNGSAWTEGGDSSRRLLRGGSWISLPRYCRSAYRVSHSPDYRDYSVGFRVSCVAPRILT